MKILKITEKGITLISLVITIIILLILAGITIGLVAGDNGILTQAARAKEETENARRDEESALENYEQYIEGSTNGGTLTTVSGKETTNTKVQDSLGNIITIPAGFKVVNPGDNVEDGIIIEDVSHEETKGSQFVWIPAGTIHTTSGDKIITLGRYEFDDLTGKQSDYAGIFKEGSYGNVQAKNIQVFIQEATETGGYYLARYEARTLNERTNKEQALTQIVVNPNEFVYNYVTQSQAANISRNMYNNECFDSDLVNSYAWDTAILFIQECSEDKDYSRQTSSNSFFANKGTNNTEFNDERCNIFDMASNSYEWTTETSTYVSVPCVSRGGSYNDNKNFTSRRNNNSSTRSETVTSFRPILYL